MHEKVQKGLVEQRKYLLIIGDGMSDYPIFELDNKTPLQAAKKPNMDLIATKGCNGLLKTVPENMIPGSGTAILSVLGYDPRIYYTGRGPFEAVARNINLDKNDVAYRCNLITEKDGFLIDYSADHITKLEAEKLIETLKSKMDKKGKVEFFSGLDYRHFLILRNYLQKEIVEGTPPHDAIGKKISNITPKSKTEESKNIAKLLTNMIFSSKKILEKHPINKTRRQVGKRPGNMIWPWSGGKKPKIPTIKEKYGLNSAVISAVDLVKGIGVYSGMRIIEVPGATGLYNTNYEGKATYALDALKEHNLVIIHVEAPDEAGHSQDYKLKVKTIEDLDKRLIGKVIDNISKEVSIAVLPDHATPIKIGTHTRDPVPFTIYSLKNKRDRVSKFDEDSAKKGKFGLLEGEEFMSFFIR